MKKQVYVFRGSPLSGKSTLAPLFCQSVPQPAACLAHDTLRWDFHSLNRHFTTVTSEEHRFAFENLRVLFEQYLKHGRYTIVIEGLFTWDDSTSDQGDIVSLKELAQRYGYDLKSFVLKADRRTLDRRNHARAQQVPQDEFEVLYHNIYKKIDQSEIVINTTNSITASLAQLQP